MQKKRIKQFINGEITLDDLDLPELNWVLARAMDVVGERSGQASQAVH